MKIGTARPRIGLISDSVIANDPRLRRQGDALVAAGFDVLSVGQGSDGLTAPDWPIFTITPQPAVSSGLARKLRRLADIPQRMINPTHAYDIYWRLNLRYKALLQLARQQHVDLWLANDWTTLPIVMALKRESNTPFAYDTHELAVNEFAQRLFWRLNMSPVIHTIERQGLTQARFVSCVSDGIAARLQEHYRLPTRPAVIRNTPHYEPSVLRPTGKRIDVLYHGVVAPGRALEESIASVSLWRPEFSLTIRGPGEAAYLASLARLAMEEGVSERITFAPPVLMTELVSEARAFDVGLFAIKDHSLQNMYVLPNKFFEYTMAGLALCVSDLPEMRLLLERHRLGTMIADVSPGAIAAAINALDPACIDAFKANALTAARQLCWEKESETLVSLVRATIPTQGLEQQCFG